MIPDILIDCPEDTGITEAGITLRDFPFLPMVGDIIKMGGVDYRVTGRTIDTHKGVFMAKEHPPTLHLEWVIKPKKDKAGDCRQSV